MTADLLPEIYAGLRSLAGSGFPRQCANCGRVFESSAQFVAETEALRKGSGLHAGYGDLDETVVELYRNCPCGSTLVELYANRRDESPAGQERRRRFGVLMKKLQDRAGLEPAQAREAILKALRGERSEALEALGYDPR